MRHGRRDENHGEIRQALRSVGATVVDLGDVGGGVPDFLVGYRGRNYLLEVKRVSGNLNEMQKSFHSNWQGQICVVRSVADALEIIFRS